MMIVPNDIQVYLHKAPIDFRKQINGLSVLVQEELVLDPFQKALYVFVNRTRNRLKILYWQRNGFCLWMKRLEKEKFAWPKQLNHTCVTIDGQQLAWLLEGFEIWNQPPHQELFYRAVS